MQIHALSIGGELEGGVVRAIRAIVISPDQQLITRCEDCPRRDLPSGRI